MISHMWTIPCGLIITDQQTNVVSYIAAIEEATATTFPAQFPLINIGTLWRKSSAEPEILVVRALLERPSKQKEIMITVAPITMKGKLHRVVLRCGFEAQEPGVHYLMIQFRKDNKRWVTASRLPLEIHQATTETSGKPTSS
jgi:hypothetical protein